MPAGRPRTPTKILEARGSWRSKKRGAEPKPKLEAPPAPSFLKGEARAEWSRQCKELVTMGVLARVDRAALVLWCQAWAEYVAVSAELEGKAPWAKGNSRLVWIRKSAVDTLLKVAAQFGFTPAARARLNTKTQPDKPDDMEQFFEPSEN